MDASASTMDTKTFSSVKEVLENRMLEQQVRSRHKRTNSTTASSTASLYASFTDGMTPPSYVATSTDTTSKSYSTTRTSSFNSSFSSIGEDAAIEYVRLSSSPPPQEKLDLSEMTVEDLKRLKIEDPFMYYSIPEVHTSSYLFDEGAEEEEDSLGDNDPRDDVDQEAAAAQSGVSASAYMRLPSYRGPRSASMPAGILADAEIARAAFEQLQLPAQQQQRGNVVKRRRISVEAHPMLACEGIMAEIMAESGNREEEEGRDDDDEDHFLKMFMMENTRH